MGSHQALTDLQQRVLPDLWSRLSWGMRMHWHRPEHWSAVIEHVALARGLLLDAGTCQYIATRAPRDWPKIMEILQELDQAALVAKRRVTVPFIRQVLGW
jgi:DnaA family protein